MRFDPIDKAAVSVNVKSLLEPWLVKHCAWSLTRFTIGVAELTMFKRQCGKDNNGEKESVRSQAKMESQWEADGMFLGKLELYDEAIVDTPMAQLRQMASMLFRVAGKMRNAADIVCYSGAISACEKGENLRPTPVLSKKTNMCSIPGDQIVFNATISACDKSMSWIMALQFLSQMQDTELQLNPCHHRVGIRVSGKASQWDTALKSFNEEKECDEHASNVPMDNATIDACEKEDQWSTELKMLVEHGEREHLLQFRDECVRC